MDGDDELFAALHAPEPVFGRAIDLRQSAIDEARSLSDVTALPAIQALLAMFSAAGLKPQVGFNQGTRSCSLSLEMRPDGSTIEKEYTARSRLIHAMLAAMEPSDLERLEVQYAAWRARFPISSSADLLTNELALAFGRQTTVRECALTSCGSLRQAARPVPGQI